MKRNDESISRREALAAMGAAVIASSTLSMGASASGKELPQKTGGGVMSKSSKPSRMPLVFLPHGGGPWPFVDAPLFGAPGMWDKMDAYMRGLHRVPPLKPTSILVISAHWEEAVPTVTTAKAPPMLYDYSGFPPESYKVQWPAPGQPELAEQVRERLEATGITSAADGQRGFDHGTFVPLKLTYPQADIPTIQLSLKRGLNPREHVAIGRALAPLRDAGVFMVGSGMSYHNMRNFMGSMRGKPTSIADDSKAFDQWLAESMQLDASTRATRLIEWEKAPAARACHPREEHLLPLMVIAGAAGNDPSSLPYRDVVMNAHVSAVHFG